MSIAFSEIIDRKTRTFELPFDGINLEVVEIKRENEIFREFWLTDGTMKMYFTGFSDHQTIYGKKKVFNLEESIDLAMSYIEIDVELFREQVAAIDEWAERKVW